MSKFTRKAVLDAFMSPDGTTITNSYEISGMPHMMAVQHCDDPSGEIFLFHKDETSYQGIEEAVKSYEFFCDTSQLPDDEYAIRWQEHFAQLVGWLCPDWEDDPRIIDFTKRIGLTY